MQYSPSRRTALVLCGTGAHGAYHGGVLRALQEAGVKVDVVAGQGVGAAAAMLAAIDGSARLWEPAGIWHSPESRLFYAWTHEMRVVWWTFGVLTAALLVPPLVVLAGAPTTLVAVVSQIVIAIAIVSGAVLATTIAVARFRRKGKRRAAGNPWWDVSGAPLDSARAIRTFSQTVWQLIRGAAHDTEPPANAGRRYAELLAESVGQPGFRELMVIATDLDGRGDVVAAMLREPYRREFIAPRPGRERRAEALDLSGAGREHALDIMAAALTPPVGAEPRLVTFAPDGYWRGETHRLCDRPGALVRLFDELAGAGVSQLVVVTAVPTSFAPHRLRIPRLDLRSRVGEFIAAAESAALQEALGLARLRFDSNYVIRPSHNPVGPFDVAGAYDEASDRRHSTIELLEQGYEDAYQQFIEPVVGASGEHLTQADHKPPSLA